MRCPCLLLVLPVLCSCVANEVAVTAVAPPPPAVTVTVKDLTSDTKISITFQALTAVGGRLEKGARSTYQVLLDDGTWSTAVEFTQAELDALEKASGTATVKIDVASQGKNINQAPYGVKLNLRYVENNNKKHDIAQELKFTHGIL